MQWWLSCLTAGVCLSLHFGVLFVIVLVRVNCSQRLQQYHALQEPTVLSGVRAMVAKRQVSELRADFKDAVHRSVSQLMPEMMQAYLQGSQGREWLQSGLRSALQQVLLQPSTAVASKDMPVSSRSNPNAVGNAAAHIPASQTNMIQQALMQAMAAPEMGTLLSTGVARVFAQAVAGTKGQ